MKIVNRQPVTSADISAAKHSVLKESFTLLFLTLSVLVVIYFCVGWLTDWLVRRIDFVQEARFFQSVDFVDSFEFSTVSENSADLQRVRTIFNHLAASQKVPGVEFNIVLLDMPEINAFAFPGGVIGVSKGLVDNVASDIELAFVLSHELGHFYNRDHLQALGRSLGMSFAYLVIFGGQVDQQLFNQVVLSVIQNTYSREQEIEADAFALDLIYEHYASDASFASLFELMQSKQNLPNWAHNLSTHPSTEDRVKRLELQFEELKKNADQN